MKTKNLLLVRVLMASSGVYLRGLRKAMRAVVCALCVLATASCAYAAASLRPLGFVTGDNYSSANGVSADGSVVVGTRGLQPYVGAGHYQAFRWTAGSGMQSLWDVLLANGGDPAVFVSPDYASGISTVGQGEQGGDGMSEAWVATIPATIGASPALSINSSLSTANHLVFTWPTNYAGFTPQCSTGLGSTNWTTCTNPIIASGGFNFVTNPLSAGAQFFRLKK